MVGFRLTTESMPVKQDLFLHRQRKGIPKAEKGWRYELQTGRKSEQHRTAEALVIKWAFSQLTDQSTGERWTSFLSELFTGTVTGSSLWDLLILLQWRLIRASATATPRHLIGLALSFSPKGAHPLPHRTAADCWPGKGCDDQTDEHTDAKHGTVTATGKRSRVLINIGRSTRTHRSKF